MIKAVFFDLYQTLVCYDPPREELIARYLGEFGIEAPPEIFRDPIIAADEYAYGEIARLPLSARSTEEKTALFVRHQAIMLEEAGVEADNSIVVQLLMKMQQAKLDLVLFADVKSVLSDLKEKGLYLGMISNVEQNMDKQLESLGLTTLLDTIVTSQDTGIGKPNPPIFLEALKRAGVQPQEAIFVGDQYQVDVVGSRNAGMQAILIDRTNHYMEITDCPRIQSLSEISSFL